jgi:hypothetical protein
MPGIGGGLGQFLGGIAGLFGRKQKNPGDVANQYLGQIPGAVKPYYQPYIESGNNARNALSPQLQAMFQNGGDFLNKIGAGYKESPGYQFKLNQALQAGGNAAAAGGLLGSNQHQQLSEQTANDIASQDYYDYINHVLGIMAAGQQGLGELNQQGYNASTGYGNALGDTLGAQAGYGYAGQAGQNAARAKNWANIFGGLGNAAGGVASAGGFF